MGVDIGSGCYRVGSDDILFMESAINMYMHCCFLKWYVQLLCVHCVWTLVHFVCIGVAFARFGFVWLSDVCLAFPNMQVIYLGVDFLWSSVDLRFHAPAFFMATPANPSTMSHVSGTSFPAPAIAVSVGGSCSTMAMTPAPGYRERPFFKQRVLMITHGEELPTATMQEVVQISSTASIIIFFPAHCMYLLHLRLMHWTSMGSYSLSMRLQVLVATTLIVSMSNQTPNCYQPHMNLQQRSEKFRKEGFNFCHFTLTCHFNF